MPRPHKMMCFRQYPSTVITATNYSGKKTKQRHAFCMQFAFGHQCILGPSSNYISNVTEIQNPSYISER